MGLTGSTRLSSFDPQALTSLTRDILSLNFGITEFRSTGSYEPDHRLKKFIGSACGFDPQALTSLTK